MQIEIKSIAFKNTFQASTIRCGICQFHYAELDLMAWQGSVTVRPVQRQVCPRCANLPKDILESILFPAEVAPESAPAAAFGY